MPFTLAQVQPVHTTGDLLILACVGLLVVFAALSLIGGVMAGLTRLLARFETPAAPLLPAEPLQPVSTEGLHEDVMPHTVAVITAAAFAAVGRPLRIRRVTFVRPNSATAWKGVGRATIQASHNFKR